MTARALYDDHGALQGLGDDDHAQYLLLAGRAGGQTAFGSPTTAESLTLGGSSGANPGTIECLSGINVQDISAGTQAYALEYDPTQNLGVYIGGGVNISPDVTFTGGTFIYEVLRGAPRVTSATTPGFAAFTLFNALAILRSATAGNNPLQSLCLNVGVVIENAAPAGTALTTANNTGVNFAPQTRVLNAFSTMSVTAQTGLTVSPTFSTVNLSVANLGTIRGVHCRNVTNALFQPAAGVENMTAYIGLDMDNITFGGTVTKAAVRSALPAATNAYFLLQTSTAQSVLLGQFRFQADLTGISFGASDDFNVGWGASNFFFFNFAVTNPAQLRFSSETPGNTTDRFLIQASVASAELNLNFDRFSLGDQTGAVGNSVGQFIAGTRTVSVGGEWSDFLLTQAGNITVDAAMGLVAAWTVNAPSITIGTGSVTTSAALNVGGNPGSATNRAGVRIISNPSGGAGVNAALWVTTGSSRFDGRVDINNGIALGGGAAATLGTIGGSGPTAAAQAQWLEVDINGVAHWVAVWT